jgi:hypothetical protein
MQTTCRTSDWPPHGASGAPLRAVGRRSIGPVALLALAIQSAARAEAPTADWGPDAALVGIGEAALPLPQGFSPLTQSWDRVEARHRDGSVLELERLALRRPLGPEGGWGPAEAARLLARLGPGASADQVDAEALGEGLRLRFGAEDHGGRAEVELRLWTAAAHTIRARLVRPAALPGDGDDHWQAILDALSPADLPAAPTPPEATPDPGACASPADYGPLLHGERDLMEGLVGEPPPSGAACAWAARRAADGELGLLRWCALDTPLPPLSAPRGPAIAAARLRGRTGGSGWALGPGGVLTGRAGPTDRVLTAVPTGEGAVSLEAWTLRGPVELQAGPPPALRCPAHRPRWRDRLVAQPALPLSVIGGLLLAFAGLGLGRRRRIGA